MITVMFLALVACDQIHIHRFSQWKVIKEATEIEDGIKERTCACGEREIETLEKLNSSQGLAYALNQDEKG